MPTQDEKTQHRGLGTISVERRRVEKTMGEGWGVGREKVGGGRKECVCGRGGVVGEPGVCISSSIACRQVRERMTALLVGVLA